MCGLGIVKIFFIPESLRRLKEGSEMQLQEISLPVSMERECAHSLG